MAFKVGKNSLSVLDRFNNLSGVVPFSERKKLLFFLPENNRYENNKIDIFIVDIREIYFRFKYRCAKKNKISI